jgi:hypothetical protein
MIRHTPRRFKFKAYNKESGLVMRLNSIECHKGELTKKDHVLLPFTGLTDRHEEEIYDMDVLLLASRKHVVQWNEERMCWRLVHLEQTNDGRDFTPEDARESVRLCSYFEIEKKVTS